jgi:heptosyltransferase-2
VGSEIKPESIERVVVRGANWVGDAAMTVPALRELRRVLPGAHLTLATRPWAEALFAGAEFVDEVIAVSDAKSSARSVWADARAWRSLRFDLAVLFPNSFAPALAAALARVPVRIGYATQGRAALLTHPLPVPEWRGRRHEVFYYLNIIAGLERILRGSTDIDKREPDSSLAVKEDARRDALALLRESGATDSRPLVALCPGSTNSRAKRWPSERFAALADMLAERAGAQVFLIGAREELDISEEVARLTRSRPHILTGKTNLAQTAALLSVADLLVTNDTGPAHVAAAVGCPVVVIFGPTNPETTRPFSASAEVVRKPPVCAPCMLRDCPIDHRCMTAITAEDVFERAAHALEARRAAEAVL